MLFKRIIPVLLLNDGSLVKTVNFRNADYIGDPCNTAKIFNELNADELIVLDIGKSKGNLAPDFDLIAALARSVSCHSLMAAALTNWSMQRCFSRWRGKGLY